MPYIEQPTDYLRLRNHLDRGGEHSYFHFLPARVSHWYEGQCPSQFHILPGVNVYAGVHPTTVIPPTNATGKPQQPCYVRSQKWCIAAVNCLFAELDLKDFNNDLSALTGHIDSLPVPPSVQIFSGGGIHAYWLFAEPFIIASDDHRTAIDYVQKAWVTLVGGDDASKDLTRILRVPDTYNYKYNPPRLVMMLDCDLDRTYALSDFTIHLEPPKPKPAPRPPRRTSGPRPIETFNIQTHIDDLLQHYGYRHAGRNRMLSPYSTTGNAGVYIDDTTNRAFVHHGSDPLCTGYWVRPFDVVKVLDCGGNWRAALDTIRGAV